jgi:subtilisin family serine protease
MGFRPLAAALALAAALPCPAPAAEGRRKIERADQLPVHAYAVPGSVSKVLADEALLARLLAEVRRDIEADLAAFDVEDRATLRGFQSALSGVALLQGRLDDALAASQRARELQEKPALKLLTGLQLRAIVAARKGPADRRTETFAAALRKDLAAMPWEEIQADLKEMKAGLEIQSRNLVEGVVEEQLDPAAKGGSIPREVAVEAVRRAVSLRETLAYRDATVAALQELVDAHRVEKADIWAARSVSLDGASGLTPVVVGIWDSGVDTALFPDRLWVNKGEVAGNGKDDDGNGWVDDVNGIAFDWSGAQVAGLLEPVRIPAADYALGRQFSKGFSELSAGLDGPDAQAVKKRVSTLPKEQVKGFLEALAFFDERGHGTHVAGIASAGNPAARLLVVRMEYPYQLAPPLLTDAWARGQAGLMRESPRYLAAAGARVVNMSWVNTPREFEQMLEANAVGTAEERRRTARGWFDQLKAALQEGMTAAKGVLWVAAAGNENADARFEDAVPSSLDLPNSITVGAVDRAGDEASFTSYGKVDVYANGFQVESVLPGGEVQAWSGTSMAAPQVANLAAKILARHPGLSPVQVKRAIVEGADEKVVTGRKLRLLNPKRSLALAARLAAAP